VPQRASKPRFSLTFLCHAEARSRRGQLRSRAVRIKCNMVRALRFRRLQDLHFNPQFSRSHRTVTACAEKPPTPHPNKSFLFRLGDCRNAVCENLTLVVHTMGILFAVLGAAWRDSVVSSPRGRIPCGGLSWEGVPAWLPGPCSGTQRLCVRQTAGRCSASVLTRDVPAVQNGARATPAAPRISSRGLPSPCPLPPPR